MIMTVIINNLFLYQLKTLKKLTLLILENLFFSTPVENICIQISNIIQNFTIILL